LPFSSHSTPTTEFSTLSLHDALPIYRARSGVTRTNIRSVARQIQRSALNVDGAAVVERGGDRRNRGATALGEDAKIVHYRRDARSEEHTSELQSRRDVVCRLLREKKE